MYAAAARGALSGGCPLGGAVCGAGRDGARALAAHRCNCKRARLCRCVGVAAGCVDGHACFRARLANRSMARTAAGFVCEERIEGAVERCEGREEVCVGCTSALVAVYASNYCRPIARSSGILRFQALGLHRDLLSHRCVSNPSANCCETQGFRLFHSEDPQSTGFLPREGSDTLRATTQNHARVNPPPRHHARPPPHERRPHRRGQDQVAADGLH